MSPVVVAVAISVLVRAVLPGAGNGRVLVVGFCLIVLFYLAKER